MKTIKDFLKKEQPFSVIQYFESFSSMKTETIKKYELIYMTKDRFVSRQLEGDNLDYFKSIKYQMDLIINSKEGVVYEYNGFKQSFNNANGNIVDSYYDQQRKENKETT
jgi:hypothetical protein